MCVGVTAGAYILTLFAVSFSQICKNVVVIFRIPNPLVLFLESAR